LRYVTPPVTALGMVASRSVCTEEQNNVIAILRVTF
jgi:hypothetical protein